jgi:two-component system OmpR family response regulator
MRILIVEDEARLADSVARGLREEGFIVETSGDGKDALHRLRTEPFDLAILDVMLPGRPGSSLRARAFPTPAQSG